MTRKKRGYKTEMTNNQPMVRFLFEEIDRKKIQLSDLGKMAGIEGATLSAWRTKTTPNVANLEAALNALGYTLDVKKL